MNMPCNMRAICLLVVELKSNRVGPISLFYVLKSIINFMFSLDKFINTVCSPNVKWCNESCTIMLLKHKCFCLIKKSSSRLIVKWCLKSLICVVHCIKLFHDWCVLCNYLYSTNRLFEPCFKTFNCLKFP